MPAVARPGRESGCEYPRGMDERVAKGSNRMNELDRMRRQIIAELGVAPRIDAGVEVRDRIDFIKQYLAAAHATTLVLGISGGQDSTLAGRLCQLAVEEIRDAGGTAEFIAVRLPYAVQHDESDAQGALEFIRPDRTLACNIEAPVDAFAEVFDGAFGAPLTDFNKGNVKARARMVAQYAIAGQTQGLVVGTDHAAEALTGFFTKYGDGGADLVPLAGLSKGQGRELLRKLGAPEYLITKVPTADLLDGVPGQTDEANLGVSYEHIDAFLEGRAVPEDVSARLVEGYLRSAHKRHTPAAMQDSWWRRAE